MLLQETFPHRGAVAVVFLLLPGLKAHGLGLAVGEGQLRGRCCSVSLTCCLALGRLCSRKCSDTHLASKGSADGELKGHPGALLCMHRVCSAGERGAEAGLGPSRLEVSRLSLALFSDPGGSSGTGAEHRLSRSSRQALRLLYQRLALAGHGVSWAGVGAPSSAGVQEGGACGAGKLQLCRVVPCRAVPCCAVPGGMYV